MSALLTALKKAAEEKQKRRGQEPSNLEVTPSQVSNSVDQIQFQLTDEEDSVSTESAKETASNPQESVQLNFVDESLNTGFSQPPLSDQNELITDSELTESSETMDQADVSEFESLAIDETPSTSDSTPVPEIALESAVELKPDIEEKSNPEEDNEKATAELDENSNLSSLKMVSETSETPSNDDQRLDLETSLALNDDAVKSTPLRPSEESHSDAKSVVQREQKLPENEAPEDDWSLDQIPGYQQTNETQNDQAKMQRFIHAIKPKTSGLKKQFSIKYWMWIPLILLGFSYYGLKVYEQEYRQMTEDLKPFQRLSPNINLDVGVAKVDAPEKSKAASAIAKVPLEDAPPSAKSEDSVEKTPLETKPSVEKTILADSDEPRWPKSPIQANNKGVESKVVQPIVTKKTALKQPQDPSFKIQAVTPKGEVFLGYEAYAKGDYAAADSYYQQAYRTDPESMPVLFGLAATAVKKGETQKALAMYQKILEKDPNNQQAVVAEAVLGANLNTGPEVRKKLEDLSFKIPNNAKLQSALGHQYAKDQNWVLAQKYYFKAYELAQNNTDYARNLAVSLDRLGQYTLAKHYYELALTSSSQPSQQQIQIKNRLLAIKQHLLQESKP